MKEGPDISHLAALIGDPARANMLTALMSGKALTVSELAEESGVTIQTASSHLSKLHDGGLLRPRKQGRHKYFSLANEEVAHVLEGLMGLAAGAGHLRKRTGPRDAELRKARVCYNHLAGDMGTQLFDSLLAKGHLAFDGDDLALTGAGGDFVERFGINLDALCAKRAPLCRECLDWSERRSHLAGSLGRAFLSKFEELGWASRDQRTRVVAFSRDGTKEFERLFAVV
ncbi:MAG: winged helix-turn-helix domain-containing protein [Planctomycetota bacterium]